MSETPKKRAGRPRKSPTEKAEQFSIRLPFLPKLVLEVIARDKGLSLSQAAEYAIMQTAEKYEFEGVRILDDIKQRVEAGLRARFGEVDKDPLSLDGLIAKQEWLHTASAKVFLMPESLLTPAECYFRDVLIGLRSLEALPTRKLDDLFDFCVAAYPSGLSVESMVQRLKFVVEDGLMLVKDDSKAATIIGDNVAQGGRGFGKHNPTPRGPAPKGGKKPSAK